MAYNKETNMYESYIYCIENLVNGKKYIGQTRTNIKGRCTKLLITYGNINITKNVLN